MIKKNQGKKTTIGVSVCDQGNGGSYCSLCFGDLDHGNPFNRPDTGTECPYCGAYLESVEDCFIIGGGSDF